MKNLEDFRRAAGLATELRVLLEQMQSDEAEILDAQDEPTEEQETLVTILEELTSLAEDIEGSLDEAVGNV